MSANGPAPFASAYIKDGVVQHVHYARCEPCMYGDHSGGEHGWAGPEDIAHAAKTGQPDPSNQRCGCHCYGTPEDPRDVARGGRRMTALLHLLAAAPFRILGEKCPICRERRRYMDAHVAVDHYGED